MRYLLASVLLLGVVASGRVARADANERTADRVERIFGKLDTNNDGRISREEANGGRRLAHHFDLIDADKDGYITRSELTAFLDAHPHGKHG
jgi:Ca2+-binding EF-hand superfamily protein